MQNDDDFRRFIETRQWCFAKTMPQWPHEYTVRKFQDPKDEQTLFEQAVAFIRAHGERRTFEPTGRSSIYFDTDGRQYWTMGAPIEETIIINRAWLDWRDRLARGERAKSVEACRERFLSQAELGRLGDALREAEQEKSCSPWVIAAIRLLTLTGARRNEILTLRWEHVSEEHGCLMLPDSKTGRKAVRLSAPALALLHEIPRLEGNPYVICGERPGRHLVNLEKPWRRIRAAAKLDDVRLHDLRHSYASVAASGGQSLLIIGKLLGHSQPETTARYAHLADDPVKAASEAIGSHIASTMASGKGGDVVNFKGSGFVANPAPDLSPDIWENDTLPDPAVVNASYPQSHHDKWNKITAEFLAKHKKPGKKKSE